MELTSMSVGGVAPVVSPWLVVFLLVFIAGAAMAILRLMRHNLRLVFSKGFNPFSISDAGRAMANEVSTLRPGEAPFARSLYGRVSIGLMAVGGLGVAVFLLVGLFGG